MSDAETWSVQAALVIMFEAYIYLDMTTTRAGSHANLVIRWNTRFRKMTVEISVLTQTNTSFSKETYSSDP